MDKKIESTTADKIGGAAKAEQASAASNNAVPRRRANIKMVQNVLLVSLDNNIDDNSNDCRNTISQLQRVVDDLITFTDDDECIEFIETINDIKTCMIIPGYLGQHIVPRVHNMPQVDSIFIFCSNKQRYEQWAKDWSKIKGIFTEITPICEALSQAAQKCEQNNISISIMATSGDMSQKNLDQLGPSFMYTQILKEILLTITFEAQHINEFIKYCRDLFPRTNNTGQLRHVTELERNYHDKTPIWWYTNQCFLYPMLNSALRLTDVEHLIKIGFFIFDLHQHIEQLHKEQFGAHNSSKIFTVYRGQGLDKEEFEKIKEAKDGLISFNNFLSTSYNRDVAYLMAESNQYNPDLVGIMFAMTIDPSKSSTPFASINRVSHFEEEDEVLFSMHTVFHIGDITPMAKNLFQVDLTLTDDNDKDLRVLTDCIREETYPNEAGWYRLGSLLLKMGESDQAQQVYEILLPQTTNDSEKGRIYHRLGLVKYNQGEYKEALRFYRKALTIRQQSLPPNRDLANSYNNIGLVYKNMREYSKALSSYEKALEIQQQSFPPNHPDLASSYGNIGNVYYNMGEYLKALSSHEKALAIKQKSLPSNHPDLAASYGNIGNVYYSMSQCSKAVSSHEKALEIQQQSLPPNHPHLASSYCNIGNAYYNMGEYSKAFSSQEKALAIRQQSLPPNHPELASSYNNIGLVYENIGNYSKALSFYERAVDNGEQSLPSNHPTLQQRRKNLDRVRKKL
jgi:tetratricopeptide (TPR) repeat protein